jgi:hypothetical protein
MRVGDVHAVHRQHAPRVKARVLEVRGPGRVEVEFLADPGATYGIRSFNGGWLLISRRDS